MAANSIHADQNPGGAPTSGAPSSWGADSKPPVKPRGASFSIGNVITRILAPAASLNLTVTLLCMAIFLVFVGTLAQDEEDMWEVVHNYFRSFLTWVEFEVFFPKSWFPSLQGKIPGKFPFPGGLTVGAFMALNLFAAHAVRFKVQTKGWQLLSGLAIILLGAALALLVVVSGHNASGLQDEPVIGWIGVWYILKTGLVSLWLASLIGATVLVSRKGIDKPGSWFAVGGAIALTAPIVWLLYMGDAARLSDSSLRILWQLAQGWVAALVMLVGCFLAFRQRAGIVLLHLGVGLIMFNELFVGLYTVEERMHINEGQIVNFARDIRSVELAVVDPSDKETDSVIAVPLSSLKKDGTPLRHELLPFDVQLVEYHKNANLRKLAAGETPLATLGEGTKMGVEPVRPGSGADTDSSVDMAAAYITLTGKNGEGDLGTLLVSQIMGEQEHPERVEIGKKNYDIYLRFKRNYKPYAVRLLDVAKRDYVGTATPRDYSSNVQLIDPSRKFERDEIRIWMNNPLRYAGETFYQSGYNRARSGLESTDLQVVTNTGWMIPYLGCMVVMTGLLAQFGLTLLRFVNKLTTLPAIPAAALLKTPKGPRPVRQMQPLQTTARSSSGGNPTMQILSIGLTVLVVLGCVLYLGSKARSPKLPADGFDLNAFGRLPLVYQGRVKPFDTLARNSMRIISDREDFKDEEGKRQPAIRWLADLASDAKVTVQEELVIDNASGQLVRERKAERQKLIDAGKAKVKSQPREVPRVLTYKVFRIEHPDVLETLDLEPRIGSYRYSAYEMLPQMEAFENQVEQAKKLKTEETSLYQKKLLDLDRKIRTFTLISASFRTLDFPAMPTEEEFRKDPEGVAARADELRAMLQQIPRVDQMLSEMQPPLAVPVPAKFRQDADKVPGGGEPEKWLPYARAWHEAFVKRELLKQPVNPAAEKLHNMLAAYAANNPGAFNRELKEYQTWLAETLPTDVKVVGGDKPLAAIDVAPANDDPGNINFSKVRFESFFNNFAPFYYAVILYGFAHVLAELGMLMMPLNWSLPFRRAAFWLIAFTFAVHTVALIGRIYISGRPPVTNLYSSAIFIGWAMVLAGIVIEAVFRVGIGNLVASVVGFCTLIIAHNLAGDGDTFTVLQAVLDTQFWLATHVTCVTLGYGATFLAGALGVLYVILGLFTPALGEKVERISGSGEGFVQLSSMNETIGRVLGWMIYGVLCFALLFSFYGTVLGGLWADDSWGRFWGWDPKENGALIIVLWNAVILHARWGGLVKDRGMAVLAIVGNIVTSWSWFGVNELGIGLHSYGFTEGVLRNLGLFVLSQLLLIGLGCIPKSLWWSFLPSPKNSASSDDEPLVAEVV